ncbi:MAG: enoyl-CoA hydratase-related protein [Porticoccaceae bacterium]
MTDNNNVVTTDSGRVRTLRMNRVSALNAFNDRQYDDVADALNRAAHDDSVAVVIITGTGRAFSAGADLTEMGNPPKHDDGRRHGFPWFLDALVTFPKPLIAAVNGLGVGIGLTLLPHCDFVLISESARLRAPFASLGVTVEAGNSFLLPATVGWANAAHILYTGEWLDADKCVEIGLAWKKTGAEELMVEAAALAEQIAAMPIVSLVHTKKLLLATRLDAMEAARKRETEAFRELIGGPANREAILAFMEKRPPNFTNPK